MHRPIFGHSFAVFVAPILLSVLAFKFLNKRKTSARRKTEDVDSSSSTETSNAASSLSAAVTGNCYEVFLSFRGPDTRDGFTDHLYDGLLRAGINTFRDDDELCQGEDIRPMLTAAITNSKILIPILSVTYGTSSWCLDELVQIMELKNDEGRMVLPIFYKVKPAEVRHQTGDFGKAFHKRERRMRWRSSFDPAKLEKWKKALEQVCVLKGSEAHGYETKLVKSIVQDVLSKLKKKIDLVNSDDLVGIDDHVKNVMKLMYREHDTTLFVGIYGMGGIGKTTLAKAIYNKLSNQFEHRSFIADIRESWKNNGVRDLQNKLVSDILREKNRVPRVDEEISSMFKNKKVLLLLDDVDSVAQLESLAGNGNWFSSTSRIIITTRNETILKEAEVDYVYGHEQMDETQSMILFSKHAFREDFPAKPFEDLTREVVSITGGLPLCLKVFGSLFRGKKSTQWREMIDKLKKVPNIEVQNRLRISYEALDDDQKEIYLDIACFFIGTDKRTASYMWKACGFLAGVDIEVLRSLSLIKVGNDHKLIMHDQLRDLGRKIVREEHKQPCCRSRLWDSKEALKVLKDNKGTNEIGAINLSGGGWTDWSWLKKDVIYTEEQFKNLRCLRFLQMEGAHLSGDFKNSMEELKWLRWKGCPENFEVTNFHVNELVILELPRSEINEKWEGWRYFMMAEKLKCLDLSYCEHLKNADFLSNFENLEVLILNDCSSLKQIDSLIKHMKSLVRLELGGCRSLMKLPDRITSLENLEVLDVSNSSIEELPKGIGKLTKLQELYASSCSNEKVQCSQSKHELKFTQRRGDFSSYKLQSLPDLPPSLTYLHITCQSRKLPSLSHLVHLKELHFWDCPFLEGIKLPSALSKTSKCSQSKLPQSLNTPFELENLDFTGCRCKSLTYLLVRDCPNLVEIQGIDRLEFLEKLDISGCTSIKRLLLPGFGNLKELDAFGCNKLAEIEGLHELKILERLNISWCTSIKRLLLPGSGNLKKLDACGCNRLAEIEGLHGLKILEWLDISGCTSIERLLLPESGNLKKLDAHSCNALAEIEGLHGLKILEWLNISGCTSIERLLLPGSGNLKKLDAYGCNRLAEIEGLHGLKILELDIPRYTSIKWLEFPTKSDVDGSRSSTDNSEVFLSFRDLDTRKNFTDDLYHELLDAGIHVSHVFRDDDKLFSGEKIGPEHLAAIRSSKILIPVLSVNYGESRWCLDELAQMMECKDTNGHIVLPIFYNVKPTDVRHQEGSFGDAFWRHSSERTVDQLEKWKKALDEVSKLKGYEADGCEGVLVKSIVQKVLSELKKEYELVASENLVGIDGHVKKIMKLVDDDSSDTRIIGILGMGGVGKTTLAKTIYNKLSDQFMYRSFIADFRESYLRNGLVHVQNQLIFDILKQKDQVSNMDEGISCISSKIKNKKVLILLDDVDNHYQLEALIGDGNWFSSGSRVLITTRRDSTLANVRYCYHYDLEAMNGDDSMVLFSRHAFRRSTPPREFDDFAHHVVTTTGGIPLLLEVLGSLLCGKKIPFWRDTIYKLKETHWDQQKHLMVSYEALDDGQKQIFLDIACLFSGTDKRIATYMWDANDFFPEEGIQVLIFMSLIKCGDNHVLQMHDLLRDLGKAIVCEKNWQNPHYYSRLWNPEEAQKVLQNNQGTNQIEAINLIEGDRRKLWLGVEHNTYTGEQFKNMMHLRFLQMEGAHLSGDFKMEELKWLRWEGCPWNFEVTKFHVKELVILELQGSLMNKEWEGWRYFTMAKKLKYLDLSSCYKLENTGFLSAFKNLEVLILRGCRQLQRIDSSIGDMKNLRHLDLCGCHRLRELPAEIGELKALEQLLLRHIESLSTLPDSITSLENLEVLDVSGSGIEELPKGIRKLTKLRELYVSSCSSLRGEMLESMCNLSSLQHLDFRFCFEFQSLPDLPPSLTSLHITCRSRKLPSLSHLIHLKQLRLWGCESLECIEEVPSALSKTSECSQLIDAEESELPQSLNTPYELEYLDVAGCKSIKTLDVSEYIHLRALRVTICENLPEVRGINKLICLERLIVEGCNSIKQLDLPESKSLAFLLVRDCSNLVNVQGINRLEFLTDLYVKECTSLERLLLPKSQSLKRLHCCGCEKLTEIQDLDGLKFLEMLDISGCTSIKRVLLSELRNLKILDAHGCNKLAEIEDLDELEFLEELNISKCTSIKRLEFPELRRLKRVVANGCENLAEIQGLDGLKFLEVLDISNCTSIERVLLPESINLKTLDAHDCNKLAEIEDLDGLEFLKELDGWKLLEHLDISNCTSIKRLKFSESRRLKRVVANGCENLAEIQGLDGLEFLEELDISKCTSIKRLEFPELRRLKRVVANGCENLAEIQGLDGFEFLEELDISKCTSIKRLEFSELKRLKMVVANGCENLTEIQALDGLEFLEELDISKCTSIKRLEFPKLRRLKRVVANGCENLAEIQGLDRLTFLKELDISKCTSIKRLEFPKLWCLKRVVANGCENLAEIQGLDGLEILEELDISKCTLIKRLEFPISVWLRRVVANGCENLAEIQDLDRLTFLKKLDISKCTSITRLEFPESGWLKRVVANGCENLAEIQGLDGLEFLKELDISNCTLIKRLEFQKSGWLKRVVANGCENLAEIQGLDGLEFLEELDISKCTSIKRLEFPESGWLKRVVANGCENLAEIQGLDELKLLERLDISKCTSIKRLEFPKSGRLKSVVANGCENLTEIQGLDGLKFLEHLDISNCTSIKKLEFLELGRLQNLVADGCDKLAEIQNLDRLEFLSILSIVDCKSLKTIPELSGTWINREKPIACRIESGSDYGEDSNE